MNDVYLGDHTKKYLVHFADVTTGAFLCFADDYLHAIEQAHNAYPDEIVYSVFECHLAWHINSGATISPRNPYGLPISEDNSRIPNE